MVLAFAGAATESAKAAASRTLDLVIDHSSCFEPQLVLSSKSSAANGVPISWAFLLVDISICCYYIFLICGRPAGVRWGPALLSAWATFGATAEAAGRQVRPR